MKPTNQIRFVDRAVRWKRVNGGLEAVEFKEVRQQWWESETEEEFDEIGMGEFRDVETVSETGA